MKKVRAKLTPTPIAKPTHHAKVTLDRVAQIVNALHDMSDDQARWRAIDAAVLIMSMKRPTVSIMTGNIT